MDFCGEQGFVFATQTALNEKLPNLRLRQNPRYQALVEKIVQRRRERAQPINGTPKLIRTLLEFGDFQCFPTMFPRIYPNGDVFYPCEPLKKDRREPVARRIVQKSLRARPQTLRGHSRLPRHLPSVRKCAFVLLRQGFLGTGGGHHSVGKGKV